MTSVSIYNTYTVCLPEIVFSTPQLIMFYATQLLQYYFVITQYCVCDRPVVIMFNYYDINTATVVLLIIVYIIRAFIIIIILLYMCIHTRSIIVYILYAFVSALVGSVQENEQTDEGYVHAYIYFKYKVILYCARDFVFKPSWPKFTSG